MFLQISRLLNIAGLLVLSHCVMGCGRAEISQVPVFPVRGTLLAGEKPATGAMLTLHPVDAAARTSLRSLATVGNDGGFAFSTYTNGDGAPAGNFVLTAYWPDALRAPKDPDGESEQLSPDLLGGRFSSPGQSRLRVQVAPQPNHLAPVDLNDRTINQATVFAIPRQSS